MIQTIMTSGLGLTEREWFLLIIGMVVYAVLFVVTVQNSRRKMVAMHEKIRTLQESQQAQSLQSIAENETKIAELETLLKKLGDENSLLRLELEEKKATLDYNNKVARLENEKREHAETMIFSSDVYQRIQACLNSGRSMTHQDWTELTEVVNSIYTGFTEKLYDQPLPHVGTRLPRESVDQGADPAQGHRTADGPLEGERGIDTQPTLFEGVRHQGLVEGLGRLYIITLKTIRL